MLRIGLSVSGFSEVSLSAPELPTEAACSQRPPAPRAAPRCYSIRREAPGGGTGDRNGPAIRLTVRARLGPSHSPLRLDGRLALPRPIRRRAADPRSGPQNEAIELLGHNDDPATRDLLQRLLAQTAEPWVLETVLASARRLWGEEALGPDVAVLRNPGLDGGERDVLFRRLKERGDARRLLEALPQLGPETARRVRDILLSRQPLPVAGG